MKKLLLIIILFACGFSLAGKKHKCPYENCGYSTDKKSNFSRHERAHNNEKPFECGQCDKVFTRKDDLTRHLRIHTGEKSYKCSYCVKAFSDQSALKTHERIHTGERPYQCNQCDKAFAQKTTLTSHIRTHTGEKPYNCNQCAKKFTEKKHLTEHQRIHTGEKPYKCEECGQAFAKKANCAKHKKTHSKQTKKEEKLIEKRSKTAKSPAVQSLVANAIANGNGAFVKQSNEMKQRVQDIIDKMPKNGFSFDAQGQESQEDCQKSGVPEQSEMQDFDEASIAAYAASMARQPAMQYFDSELTPAEAATIDQYLNDYAEEQSSAAVAAYRPEQHLDMEN